MTNALGPGRSSAIGNAQYVRLSNWAEEVGGHIQLSTSVTAVSTAGIAAVEDGEHARPRVTVDLLLQH